LGAPQFSAKASFPTIPVKTVPSFSTSVSALSLSDRVTATVAKERRPQALAKVGHQFAERETRHINPEAR
jgi:hypothetical protein